MTSRKTNMPLKIGDSVQFTADHLRSMPAADAKRVSGRIGLISGYRLGADDPIVTFSAVGRFKELKFYEVSPKNLEVVPSVPPTLKVTA